MITIQHPKNIIIYGPPGTGKTYHSISYAVSIIENKSISDVENENRCDIIKRYNSYKSNNQIIFTTFHQSLSYEEFIEGIKPYSDDEGQVSYEVENGILKQICQKAQESNNINDIEKAIEYLKSECTDKPITMKTITGIDFTVTYRGGKTFRVRSTKSTANEDIDLPANIESIKNLYKNINTDKIYNISYCKGILNYLIDKHKLPDYQSIKTEGNNENFVLIIDEINRGNVSQIFGELITLIEENKRQGNNEALEVTLPYSKDLFSVPNNLYIIGTMNTADRSVEALDVALRRRFTFYEMMPNIDLLDDNKELFKVINERILAIKGRDYQIGHSYFMNGDNLSQIFKNKIIPLLQEYFYGDYRKMGLVLGNGFVEKISINESIFANFDGADELNQEQYRLKTDVCDNDIKFNEAIKILLKKS